MHRPPFVPRQDWWRPMIFGRGIDGSLQPSSHAFQHVPTLPTLQHGRGGGAVFVDSTFHITPKIPTKEEVCNTDTFSGFCCRVPQHKRATWIYLTYFQVSVASFQIKEQICYSAPQIRQRTALPYSSWKSCTHQSLTLSPTQRSDGASVTGTLGMKCSSSHCDDCC